jgi:hypothetical protein
MGTINEQFSAVDVIRNAGRSLREKQVVWPGMTFLFRSPSVL